MPALFLFLFKVNMALVLFCAGYYLVLRHLTFYTLNRIYLVTAIIFSSLYPKINLSDFVQRHQQLTEPVQTVILNWEAPAKNLVKPLYQPNYWLWVEVIFWAGAILFAARMVMQLLSLLRLYRRSQPSQIDEHKVRLLKDDIGPFSFWRSVYVNPTKLSPTELKNVLQHEQVHVSQWHTLDLLLAELSTIFYWFNPGVWLMKRAVRENLEFITDRKILQKGADSKEYQYSLVSISLAAMPNTIVNHFNISTIKKRIIMMNAKRSSGYNITRYVFLVPAVVVLLLTFSLSKAEISKRTFKSIATAITNIATANNDKPHSSLTNDKQHSSVTIEKPLRPVVEKVAIKNTDTIYNGKSKDGKKSFFMTADLSPDSITYVINGIKASKAELKALDPAKAISMELVAPEKAKEFYPEADNKRYVLFVTTDDSEEGKKLKEKMYKTMGSPNLARVKNITLHSNETSSDSAPIIGSSSGVNIAYSSDAPVGLESDSKNVSKVIVTDVEPKVKAKTLTTVKKTFQVTAKPNADVLVTSDNAPEVVTVQDFDKTGSPDGKPREIYVNKRNINNDQLTIDGDGHPLFIIDGKETSNIKNLSPSKIKSITVLKDGSALKLYGDKGKNGVIVVTTKRGSGF